MTEGPDSPEQGDRDESPRTETASGLLAAGEGLHTRAEAFFAERALPEARGQQRAPRRVDIIREGGSYSIRFGGRQMASFCEEFSEITGYSLPVNMRQQVYITVEPIGQLRENPVAAEEQYIRMRAQQDQEARPDPPRRSDSIQTDAEGNIGWRATATHHLRQEINVIADMIDRLERL